MMNAWSPRSANINFDKTFPVFPLESAVLFPNTILPLHMFEPRYVDLAEDLIDSCGLMAVGQFREKPNAETYLNGNPLLKRDVGVGQVINYERTKDGRYVLLLFGICRAHIVSEVPHTPYRKMHLTPFDLGQGDETGLLPLRERIEDLLKRMVKESTSESVEDLSFRQDTSTKAIVDQVIDAVCHNPRERYEMLHEAAVERRAKWLIRFLEEHV